MTQPKTATGEMDNVKQRRKVLKKGKLLTC